MKNKKITLENIVDIQIDLIGNHLDTDIDLGSISLKLGEKEFIFDIIQSYRHLDDEEENTTISLDVEIDRETFPDCKFDLNQLDLLAKEVVGEIYFFADDMSIFKEANLYVKVKHTNKTIPLKLDYIFDIESE